MSVSNDINQRQDAADNLERLAAQRYLYSRAKSVRGTVAFVAGALAVAAPLLGAYWPKSSAALALAALVWALVEMMFLDGVEEQCRQLAALIQEDFDTRVFSLPWNGALGERPPPEFVVEHGADGAGDPSLRGWYADVSELPQSLAVLVCQRSSVSWDRQARTRYRTLLAALGLALVIGALCVAFLTDRSLADFLVSFAVPLLPLLQHVIKTFRGHGKAQLEQERLLGDISAAWTRGLSAGGHVAVDELRRVQDRLLILRREQTPVPDLLYRWLRSRAENSMQATTRRLIDEAKRGLTIS
nr:ABC transporter ATP-binding protein [Myxococcus sp. MH1]